MTLDRPACPACDCAAMSPFTESDDRTLLICRDCRHITWAAMPTLAQLTTFYTEQYTGTHQQEAIQADRRAYYRSHAIELATAHGAPIESLAIADVGCSYPVFLHEAAQAGAAVTVGVDWSSDARAFGRQHDIPVITPDEFLALIPDNALDVLRYSHTLEHLVDPRAVLAAHVRKLRPGGLLFLGSSETTAGADDLFEPLDKKTRLFRRLGSARPVGVEFSLPRSMQLARGEIGALDGRVITTRPSIAQLTSRALLEHHTPAALHQHSRRTGTEPRRTAGHDKHTALYLHAASVYVHENKRRFPDGTVW